MAIKLHALPILEKWDCHHCTACCRETTIPLSPEDLQRLRSQRWNQRPGFHGVATVRRSAWIGGQTVLAHRPDGTCVFLTDQGRCRIHEEFGADAKPRMCQLFPLQIVVSDRGACATTRRSCPSAAADRGRPVEARLATLKRLLRDGFGGIAAPPAAPPLVKGVRRGWKEFHLAADALQRLIADARWPLVRRLVHGLRYCALLEECRWKGVPPNDVGELIEMLAQSAPGDVGPLFQSRRPPAPSSARLFRRLGAHFIKCAPGGTPRRTWRDRFRSARASGQLARARSRLPNLHPRFPPVQVEQLEAPLGPLSAETLHPLERFFVAHVSSQQYALARPTAPLVESFYRLAFTFPMALWMLRWLAADRTPSGDDMVDVVVALERGFVMPALGTAAGFLARSGELERMVAWYGR